MVSADLTFATLRSRQLFRDEALISFPIGGNNFQQEISFTSEHVALSYFWPAIDQGFKGDKIRFRLTVQTDLGEDRDIIARLLGARSAW